MIELNSFYNALQEAGICFFAGVPDSVLKDVCGFINEIVPQGAHIIAANEGNAVGLAIGHYLATGNPALVYMQNSGLGNATNPLVSLVDRKIYSIPMVLLLGWRGEILPQGTQIPDEPQHVMQGQITLKQLDLLEIPYWVLDNNLNDVKGFISEVVSRAKSTQGPVALVARKGVFGKFSPKKVLEKAEFISREDAIAAVLEILPDEILVVSTTGMASRELFELRRKFGKGHHRDFLTVGGMGHASQIAAGIALARPELQVVCLDGDGALLMHMGGLSISSTCPNLTHIVLNNGAHDSVGGQPTRARDIDLVAIALNCGYKMVGHAKSRKEIHGLLGRMLDSHSPSFLEIQCQTGHRENLGRPDRTPVQNKKNFMDFIQRTRHGKY